MIQFLSSVDEDPAIRTLLDFIIAAKALTAIETGFDSSRFHLTNPGIITDQRA